MESSRHFSGGLAALSAALVAAVLSACPALAAGSDMTPSPQTVQAGDTISLSVTGFKPCSGGESPAVRWDTPLSYKRVAGSLTDNDFTVEFVVPPDSPAGPHTIDAGCLTKDGYASQQSVRVKVVAAAPALAPSPQSVQAGGTVTMTGSGFTQCTDPDGSTIVELSANGTPLATASGSDGAFQQAITVPFGTPAGPYPVTAQCTARPGSDLTSTSVSVVTLALSPNSGIPGTTISVAGGGYTQCHEVQLQLLRDSTQAVAAGSPIVPANGSFTATVTVPFSATPGNDYQVDAGCYPTAGGNAPIAFEQFTVTSPATSGSPTPSSPSASSTSPSPAQSGTGSSSSASPSPAQSGAGSSSSPGSPPPFTATSSASTGRTGGHWAPVALIGGTGAGLALVALLLVRALSVVHGRQGRGWVNKHLRVVAGWAGPLSADVERRPGATSVSVGLEPRLDHLGNQQYEEVAR
jgi:large repetitive protein